MRRKLAVTGTMLVALATGGAGTAWVATHQGGVGPQPSETPGITQSFEPTPTEKPTYTIAPSPTKPEVTPVPDNAIDLTTLTNLDSRPQKKITDQQIEAALASVTSFNYMEKAKDTVTICEKGSPRIVDKITIRFGACEGIVFSLLRAQYRGTPDVLAAATIVYDYAVGKYGLIHNPDSKVGKKRFDDLLANDLKLAEVPFK